MPLLIRAMSRSIDLLYPCHSEVIGHNVSAIPIGDGLIHNSNDNILSCQYSNITDCSLIISEAFFDRPNGSHINLSRPVSKEYFDDLVSQPANLTDY